MTVTTHPLLQPSSTGMDLSNRRLTIRIGVVAFVLIAGIPLTFAYGLWPFVIAGIADGSIYAIAALGLVLTYKTSGIFNFAIGAQAAASAYLFYSARVAWGLPWPLAALVAIAGVGFLGSVVLERIAYWLSEAPTVMKVAATIGLLVLLQSFLTGLYGPATIQFSAFLPQNGIHAGGVFVSWSQIIIAGLAVIATVGLYVFFKRARLGIAMQAVVDDPNLLGLQASNPTVIRRYAWAIGSVFVSVSGILIAPILGIDVNQMLLLFIAAFGAAAMASFSSLLITFVAAIAIGITSNVMADKVASHNIVVAELYTQVPFLVLVLALVVLPKAKLIERGARTIRRIRPAITFSPRVVGGATVGLIALGVVVPFLVGATYVNRYTTGIGFAIVLASLGLVLWTSGQISLCQMAFAAVGATTFAHAQSAGIPWILSLAIAGLVAACVGAVVALPSFRLSGIYLAVITFGVGLLFQNLLYGTYLMFGSAGTQTVRRPELFGLRTASDDGYYYTVLAIALLCFLAIVVVRRSRLGRLLRALSDSPLALDAHGANTRLTRLYVFCISALLAGIGGALIAGVTQSAGGDITGPFNYFNSLVLVALLAFCGRQPIISPLVAAYVFAVLDVYRPFNSTFFVKYEGVVFGLLAIGVAVLPSIVVRRQPKQRGGQRDGRSPVRDRTVLAGKGS
jgi:branched-subunit amino acid ABC-type transport system permease component